MTKIKQSFESHPAVQRWIEAQRDEAVTKPEFDPAFLSTHHERAWILSALSTFYDRDLITDVLGVVKSGKEATVFWCEAHPSTGERSLAAKVYRPRMFRSLKNDAIYRNSRAMVDGEGRIVRDRRSRLAASRKNDRGRSLQVESWIQYEYQTQCLLYEAGADVPQPFGQVGNAILMSYVGDESGAAPHLAQARLQPDEVQRHFECIMRNILLCLRYDRVHGDLSAFNILYWDGQVTLIDFAQAVDPRHGSEVYSLFERDIARVCHYFERYGLHSDPGALAAEMWTQYLVGEL